MVFKKILVPVDFSRGSVMTVSKVSELAKQLSSKLILLFVEIDPMVGIPQQEHLAEIGPPLRIAMDKFEHTYQERLKKTYDPQVKGVETEFLVVRGNPAMEIAQQAEKLGADIIIMPLRSSTLFKKLVLGSTTDHVLKTAPCPVLVLPPPPVVLS